MFRRAAVLAGGFTLEAAEAVTAADLSVDMLTAITGLINKSLLRHEHSKTAEPRFGMLETVREYTWEQLTATGEADNSRAQIAAWVAVSQPTPAPPGPAPR